MPRRCPTRVAGAMYRPRSLPARILRTASVGSRFLRLLCSKCSALLSGDNSRHLRERTSCDIYNRRRVSESSNRPDAKTSRFRMYCMSGGFCSPCSTGRLFCLFPGRNIHTARCSRRSISEFLSAPSCLCLFDCTTMIPRRIRRRTSDNSRYMGRASGSRSV